MRFWTPCLLVSAGIGERAAMVVNNQDVLLVYRCFAPHLVALPFLCFPPPPLRPHPRSHLGG